MSDHRIKPTPIALALADALLRTAPREVISRGSMLVAAGLGDTRRSRGIALDVIERMTEAGFLAPIGPDLTVTNHGREWLPYLRDQQFLTGSERRTPEGRRRGMARLAAERAAASEQRHGNEQ